MTPPMPMFFAPRTPSSRGAIAYPSNRLNRSIYFATLSATAHLDYNQPFNNCSNALCYTQSKGTYVYKPHSAAGMVGTSASASRAQRTRI